MKKIVCFIIVICIMLFSSCDQNNTNSNSLNNNSGYHVESFEVEAIVTDAQTDHWYSGKMHHYRISVSVYCEELDLSETFIEEVAGMFINTPLWGLEKGDAVIVVAKQKITSTSKQTWLDHVK